MVYQFETIENKNKLVGGIIIAKMKEIGTENKAFLLRKLNGEEIIISADQFYLSDEPRIFH